MQNCLKSSIKNISQQGIFSFLIKVVMFFTLLNITSVKAQNLNTPTSSTLSSAIQTLTPTPSTIASNARRFNSMTMVIQATIPIERILPTIVTDMLEKSRAMDTSGGDSGSESSSDGPISELFKGQGATTNDGSDVIIPLAATGGVIVFVAVVGLVISQVSKRRIANISAASDKKPKSVKAGDIEQGV
ncbi:hypothetical protein BKA69DRAFT_1088070 [Paraphysoderma sedebokerense]|nr:hypothetical protein BKA69DRAFT_1087932 [Paraphysoderma sedebokerense]KAI9139055.1 hypothetical protein BKA69DRAFT_1088070 [Paraphysoderma sedebokerense]